MSPSTPSSERLAQYAATRMCVNLEAIVSEVYRRMPSLASMAKKKNVANSSACRHYTIEKEIIDLELMGFRS